MRARTFGERALSEVHEADSSDSEYHGGHRHVDIFRGTSVDELTFIEMARDVKFCSFKKKNALEVHIKMGRGSTAIIEKYEVKRKIEFTSERKMMSYVVEDLETGKTINFVKGAETSLIERLSK